MKKIIVTTLLFIVLMNLLPISAFADSIEDDWGEDDYISYEGEDDDATGLSFSDVSSGAYYYDAVRWAVENGITSGTSATTFSPVKTCTRAEAVTFLWRAARKPEPSTTNNPFNDVSANAYYYKAVLWAVENGITSGTSTATFSPNDICSRSQIVTFMYRKAGSPSVTGESFADVPSSAYYADAVQWAVAQSITSGTGNGKFSPMKNCTRGEIVTFLYRYAK